MICEDKKTIGWFICSAKVSNGLTLVLLLLLKQLLYAKLAKVSKNFAYANFSTPKNSRSSIKYISRQYYA